MKMLGRLAIIAAMAAPAAWAHHSFSMFDMGKEMTIKGEVKEFQWTNPHIWIQVMVEESGEMVEWSVEGGSPNQLSRAGWSKRTLAPGQPVSIVLHPLRDGRPGGSLVKVLGENGKDLVNK